MDVSTVEYSHWTNEDISAGDKVCFCIPTIKRPYDVMLASLEAEIPHLDAAGWKHSAVYSVGNPYISMARNGMLRKVLDAKADVVVFIDHDLSWEPGDLCRLLATPGDVVAGTYRFKEPGERYMGALLSDIESSPRRRESDGCLYAHSVPAGFLKVTVKAVDKFIASYPDLCYGSYHSPCVDLFNHGAHKHTWFGEDYAFSRNWLACGGEIIINQYLNICHHTETTKYPGNFDLWLRREAGGDLAMMN